MDPPGLCLHGIPTLRRSAHFEENAAAVFFSLCPGVGGSSHDGYMDTWMDTKQFVIG